MGEKQGREEEKGLCSQDWMLVEEAEDEYNHRRGDCEGKAGIVHSNSRHYSPRDQR